MGSFYVIYLFPEFGGCALFSMSFGRACRSSAVFYSWFFLSSCAFRRSALGICRVAILKRLACFFFSSVLGIWRITVGGGSFLVLVCMYDQVLFVLRFLFSSAYGAFPFFASKR